MAIKARWTLSEQKRRMANINSQKSERRLRQLRDLDEISVSLHVNQKLDPKPVSELLGLNPDYESARGEVHHAGRWEITSESYSWVISSKGKVRQNFMEEHLRWLVSQISGRRINLQQLQDFGAVTYVSIRINSWSRTQRADISVDFLQLCASYRLPVRVFVHYENTDEEY